ncbi:MAG: AI-2E family transporter [Campylobacterales bacterium]|nr:AI-2E family transporter [Campylobacterales bacterium]
MENNTFLHWVGVAALSLTLWLFFPFLKSFSAALLLSMAFYPLHRALQLRLEKQKYFAMIAAVSSAALITLALAIIIFLPITLFLYHLLNNPTTIIVAVRQGGEMIGTFGTHLPSTIAWLQDPLDALFIKAKLHNDEIITFLIGWLQNGFKLFFSMIGEMIMIILFFFFLLWYGRRVNLFLLPIIPLERYVKREFLNEMTKTTAVVFYTFIGVMIAQGLAFGIFIAFFQGYNPLFLGFLTAFCSIIPIVGTGLVWIPIALHEYLDGHILNAVIISLYSWAMMAFFIDNIVKLLLLNFVNKTIGNGKQRLNDFLIFFAIVGGLATFGFWGVILGPAIVAFSITTLRALRKVNRSGLRG